MFVIVLNKENNVGHFGNASKITDKKILVSTRTPEDITIKHLRCIRRVAKKLPLASSCLSFCAPV